MIIQDLSYRSSSYYFKDFRPVIIGNIDLLLNTLLKLLSGIIHSQLSFRTVQDLIGVNFPILSQDQKYYRSPLVANITYPVIDSRLRFPSKYDTTYSILPFCNSLRTLPYRRFRRCLELSERLFNAVLIQSSVKVLYMMACTATARTL